MLKVTVCIVTYNHESYIAKALESVLCQQGDFELEILVGEDGSTDCTAEIVRKYVAQYPDKIKAVYHDPEDKIIINGRKTGRKNFLNNLLSANGTYIALLDGDDYWLDVNKLKKQLAILEANPQFVACCHAAIHVDEQGVEQSGYMGHHDVKGGCRNFTIYDVIRKNPAPALSVMFRNPYIKQFPDWLYKTDMADWPLHMLNALRGDIHYVDEKMAAYRLHDAGLWAGFRASAEKVMLSEISVWQIVAKDPLFTAYTVYIEELIDGQYSKLVKLALREKNYVKAWRYLYEKAQAGKRWFYPAILRLALRIARKQVQYALKLPRRDQA